MQIARCVEFHTSFMLYSPQVGMQQQESGVHCYAVLCLHTKYADSMASRCQWNILAKGIQSFVSVQSILKSSKENFDWGLNPRPLVWHNSTLTIWTAQPEVAAFPNTCSQLVFARIMVPVWSIKPFMPKMWYNLGSNLTGFWNQASVSTYQHSSFWTIHA